MNLLTKASLVAHILRWRLTWNRRDLDHRPRGLDPNKFLSAREAAALIPDGATVLSCGMAATAWCSIFYWAIRDAFERTGHPRDLEWVAVGAMGSRGKVPGSLEELGAPGIIRRYVGGHLETIKAILKLAEAGHVELHNLPQAEMCELLDAQARGESEVLSEVGIGSFLDPRVGSGSAVVPGRGTSYVSVAGDRLRYTLPRIQVGMFVVPYADSEGNLYATHAATLTENRSATAAVRRNGGKVLASVSRIIPRDPARIYIPAADVDAVVVNRYGAQTAGVEQRRYWPMFTLGGKPDEAAAVARLKFVNTVLKVTPERKDPELAMARMAADQLTRVVRPGANVNIGVGLPEEVCRVFVEGGMSADVHFGTETGVYGGLPAPGMFFGSAIGPEKMLSSSEIFRFWKQHLDASVLGLLEADEEGNVNLSHRGPGPTGFVGVGGAPDLAAYARTVIFIGSWMEGARFRVEGERVVPGKPGAMKFVKRVRSISISGREALRRGRRFFYATNVGLFQLTGRGMELCRVMPGIDIDGDILRASPMRIVLPESGRVPLVSREIVTGEAFRLAWPDREAAAPSGTTPRQREARAVPGPAPEA